MAPIPVLMLLAAVPLIRYDALNHLETKRATLAGHDAVVVHAALTHAHMLARENDVLHGGSAAEHAHDWAIGPCCEGQIVVAVRGHASLFLHEPHVVLIELAHV